MSAAPPTATATGKRQRDADSEGEEVEDQLPEPGASGTCVVLPSSA